MKLYTTINNEVVNKLSLEDIYRYTILCLTVNSENSSDVTFKQLGKYANESPETIKNFIDRLRLSELCFIKTKQKDTIIKRNYYNLIQGLNYRMIYKAILTVDISNPAKGLLIAICCMTINNTNKCGYNKTLIATKLKASKTTVLRCFKELEEAMLIASTNNVVLVSETILKVAQKAIVKDLLKLLAFNGKCKESEIVNYYTLNPAKLKSIENLSLSILSGTINHHHSPFKGPTQ